MLCADTRGTVASVTPRGLRLADVQAVSMRGRRTMSPARTPRGDDDRQETPRHPSYDPSGDEPAGSSTGRGTGTAGRSFAGNEIAESEAEQARGRRESMSTRDNTALGPHDQELSEGTRVSETSDAPVRTDGPLHEQAPRRAARDREGSEDG